MSTPIVTMPSTSVSLYCRPATLKDLKFGQGILLPQDGGYVLKFLREFHSCWYVFGDAFAICLGDKLPDFFPQNCFVPCS